MTTCPGELVVHQDGTVWCSEPNEGRECGGLERPHRAVWSCRLVWGPASCPRCGTTITEGLQELGEVVEGLAGADPSGDRGTS
jgi:hypothetical protein